MPDAPGPTTDIFDLATERLAWATQREQILARNIANADTPDYRPQDIAPFRSSLDQFTLRLATPDARDIAGSGNGVATTEQVVDARALDGNAVSIPDELVRVADTDTTHRTVTQLYQTYMGMFMTALGTKG